MIERAERMVSHNRRPLTVLFLIAAVTLAACGLGRDSEGDLNDVRDPVVAATVNGRPVYIEDVRAHAVSRGWLQETEDLDANSDAFYLALEELIEVRLFSMEAEARGLDRQADIRRQIENARERVLASAIYDEIDRRATDQEAIERLYRENASRLGEGEEIHLRHIQLETREAADAAKRRLDQGERFEALAFELNTDGDGGDLGFAKLADVAAPVRQAVADATVGQIVGPVQLPTGWHVFQILDRRAGNAPSLETLRPRIVDWLRYQEITQLNERLQRDARIERLREPEETLEPGGEVSAPADAQRPAQPAPQPTPDLTAPAGDAPPPFPFPLAQPQPTRPQAQPEGAAQGPITP